MGKKYGIVSCDTLNNVNSIAINQPDKIDYSRPASERGIDMLLAKYKGLPFESELQITVTNDSSAPTLQKPLFQAKIALVTDGGLVPAGNPDKLPPSNADCFFRYPIGKRKSLKSTDYEISHQGYIHTYIQEDPNRLVPLDSLNAALKQRKIGSIGEYLYTTAGVMTSVEHSQHIGEGIAASLVRDQIDGVLLTSTCGTSTRCGALIARQIEHVGIPVVQITSLPQISLDNGVSRVLTGVQVCHVLGNPKLSKIREKLLRADLVFEALDMLAQVPPEDESICRSVS